MNALQTRALKLAALAALGQFAAIASAQVTNYDAFRTQFFTQTSSSAPTTADTYQFFTRIFLANNSDADSGTLTDPNGTNYNMSFVGDGLLAFGDNTSTSQSQEESTYPDGTYTFTMNGGSNGYDGSTASIVVGPTDFSTTVPFLTGTSYNDLQNMDPLQSVSLTWNQFVDASGTQLDQTFFSVFDVTTGATLYSNWGDTSAYVGDTLSANLLQADHQYGYTLYFSSRNVQAANGTGGFSGIGGLSADDFGTNGYFTTAPEPASFALVGICALALVRRRSRR